MWLGVKGQIECERKSETGSDRATGENKVKAFQMFETEE